MFGFNGILEIYKLNTIQFIIYKCIFYQYIPILSKYLIYTVTYVSSLEMVPINQIVHNSSYGISRMIVSRVRE